jgi:hypothetical protein
LVVLAIIIYKQQKNCRNAVQRFVDDAFNDKVQKLSRKGVFTVTPRNKQYRPLKLDSGGFYSAITLHFEPGHYEVTRTVFSRFIGTQAIVLKLAESAQQPDFYFWTLPQVHCCSASQTDTSPQASIDFFREHLSQLISSEDNDEKIILIGLLCHMVQDLAAHHGITYEMHSWLDRTSKADVDYDIRSLDKSIDYTARLAKRLSDILPTLQSPPSCWFGCSMPYGEVYGREKDFNLKDALMYKNSGDNFDPSTPIIVWNTEDVVTQMLK